MTEVLLSGLFLVFIAHELLNVFCDEYILRSKKRVCLNISFIWCMEEWPVLLLVIVDCILPNWQYLLSSLQVLSGCAIIVRGQPRGGPPPERQINLSNIRAGAMARRAAQAQPDTKDTPDEVSPTVFAFLYICVCLAKAEQGPAK